MPLSIRTQRRLYYLSTAVLGVATAWLWATNLDGVNREASETITESKTVSTAVVSQTDQSPTLNQPYTPNTFRGLILRAPLYDPPPPPPPQAAPPPPLRLKLLGTVVEAGGNSEAILMTSAGQVEMHRVGATVDNAQITSIDADTITLLYHDQTVTLQPQP
ncbi:MAG: type II secretion system protein N [Planctomycetota bacterium]